VWWVLGVIVAAAGVITAAEGTVTYRPFAMAGDPIAFSRAVGSSALIGIGLIGARRSTPARYLIWLGGTWLCLAALLASGARGTILGLGIGVIGWTLGARGRTTRRLLGNTLLLFAAGTAAWVFIAGLGVDTTTMTRILALGDSNTMQRLQMWQAALARFWDRPLIGWGPGSFGWVTWGSDERAYPHNIVLEIACELGLVGLAAFVISVSPLFGLLHANRLVHCGAEYRILRSLGLFGLTVALFSADLPFNYYVWIPIELCLILQRYRGGGTTEARPVRDILVPAIHEFRGIPSR